MRRREGPPGKSLESAFQRSVIDLAKLAGWTVYFTWNSKHSPAGWVDLVLVRKATNQALFRELKRDSRPSRVTDDQRECLDGLAAAGLNAGVWTPNDWALIERTLQKPRKQGELDV